VGSKKEKKRPNNRKGSCHHKGRGGISFKKRGKNEGDGGTSGGGKKFGAT